MMEYEKFSPKIVVKAAKKNRKKGLLQDNVSQTKPVTAKIAKDTETKKAPQIARGQINSAVKKGARKTPVVETEEVLVTPATLVASAISNSPESASDSRTKLISAQSPMSKQFALTGTEIAKADPLYSFQLDGKGGGRKIGSTSKATSTNPFWIHFDYNSTTSVNWIKNTNLLPTIAKTALIGRNSVINEIRFDTHDAMLVILLGVNITPGNRPDPIVSLRFYITSNYIISTQHKTINAVGELKEDLDKNIGPVDVADWLVQISDILADYINSAVEDLHSQVILLENSVLSRQQIAPHRKIGLLRQQLILLRRNTTPQRDIFIKISTERLSWIDDNDRQHMHDAAIRMNNYISDIDGCLLRLSNIIQQINALLTESINKRIYLMSIVATLFMPLTFFSSLLGMNLAGIPFTKDPGAFGAYTLAFIFFGIFLWFWLRKKQWI